MSRRKINKQQSWRIKKIQEERAKRMKKRAEKDLSSLNSGQLGPEEEGLVITHYGSQIDVEALQGDHRGSLFRCALRTHLEDLVTGDKVVWCAGPSQSGVVVARLERRSVLARPGKRQDLKPIAANIDQLLVVFAPVPEPSTLTIDRYLVAAELTNIKPILVFNKSDLINEQNESTVVELSQLYRSLNYQVIQSSTKNRNGLDELYAALQEKVNVFVGQSGVGKSSLVNMLLPEVNARVGGLSEQVGLGTHTTSAATLYHMPCGGDLIDSPGIREFGLTHVDADRLIQGFPELQELSEQCKFRNCQHQQEPGCAIKAALMAGDIAHTRLENYLILFNEAKH